MREKRKMIFCLSCPGVCRGDKKSLLEKLLSEAREEGFGEVVFVCDFLKKEISDVAPTTKIKIGVKKGGQIDFLN